MNKLWILALVVLFASCERNETKEEETTAKDTVVVRDTVFTEEEEPAADKKRTPATKPKEEEKAPENPVWEAKMAEYHELRCRQHRNEGTATDAIRQVELYRELLAIRQGLNKDERFYFATALAKAEDMSTCAK